MQNIELEGSKNIRDLGNIEFSNSRIKIKMILRSGCLDLLSDKNSRTKLLKEILGKYEETFYIEQPFICDYGYNIDNSEFERF